MSAALAILIALALALPWLAALALLIRNDRAEQRRHRLLRRRGARQHGEIS